MFTQPATDSSCDKIPSCHNHKPSCDEQFYPGILAHGHSSQPLLPRVSGHHPLRLPALVSSVIGTQHAHSSIHHPRLLLPPTELNKCDRHPVSPTPEECPLWLCTGRFPLYTTYLGVSGLLGIDPDRDSSKVPSYTHVYSAMCLPHQHITQLVA